ncbi:MAG: hypothetical protein ACM3RP_01745 [Chitinophagales bacterium]
MLKLLVFSLGAAMTGVVASSFVAPLWRKGLKGLATVAVVLLLAAVGGLGWLLWSLAA